jgi:hypothetical protein
MHEGLRRFWPPEGQILLLTAALADMDLARRAWRQWDIGQNLADVTWAEVCLLAAIGHRVGELAPGATPDPRLIGARRHIWTQTQLTMGTTRPLLAALGAAGLRLMLLKGAARISVDPVQAQYRAIRDIDVMIHPEDWERGVGIARGEGWRTARQGSIRIESVRRRHAFNLRSPVPGALGEFDLHRYMLTECRNEGQDLDVWQRALPVRFLEVDVLRPAPADFALVALGQSMLHGGASSSHWALDVDPLIRADEIDWDLFLREVRRRRIESYVAPPLLLLKERIGTPVPAAILRDLTRRLSRVALTEFECRATAYGPRTPAEYRARRIMLSARAMQIARARPYSPEAGAQASTHPVRRAQLKAGESMKVLVPTGTPPFARLRLHLSFDVHHARGHAYLTIDGPDFALAKVPIERASKVRGGRVRRTVTVTCPACLYALRCDGEVSVKTNDRVRIRNVIASWGTPVALSRRSRVMFALQRWLDRLRQSRAG